MFKVENLSIRYGAHLALEDVSIDLNKGEAIAILGANGAGKSSLLNAICGRVKPQSGSNIRFQGQSLIGSPTHDIVEAGIILVPEGRGIFANMSVDENLALGAYPKRAIDHGNIRKEEVFELFPKLAERRNQLAGTMSGGEQQMVAIGRALMSHPELLLLDEPSLGLAPIVVHEMFAALTRIRQSGIAIILVEQNVKSSLSLVDRGYLLEAGRIVGQGTSSELQKDKAVQQAFLGSATH